MRIMYHVVNDWNDAQIKIMNEFGVYPTKGYNAIQIEKEIYLKIKNYINDWTGSEGVCYPEFTKKEISESLLSVKSGRHENGYPMPDLDGGYKELTYDLTDYCPNCGMGFKQKDAFRLKNVPPIGKKQIFGLGWVFDELFIEKSVYEEIFKPLGVKSREVLKYKQDIPFENTVQLVLDETQEKLNLEGYPTENCSVCKRYKYLAMPQGFYPMHKNIIAPIFKSSEYFGSGALAFKKIFVSKELREKLIAKKIDKDYWYIPAK